MNKQGFKYKKEESIVGNLKDDFELSSQEFYTIFEFFIVSNICRKGSLRKKSLKEYGWGSDSLNASGLRKQLQGILSLDNNFVFLDKNEDIKSQFIKHDLDGRLESLICERGVIGYINEDNQYFKLFHRIRNCLAHGSFVLKYSFNKEKMVVMQDQDQYNVTARIVLKLKTLLAIISIVKKGK